MASKSYDPQCEVLARYFLSFPAEPDRRNREVLGLLPCGHPPTKEGVCGIPWCGCTTMQQPKDEALVVELAGVIQQAIEDWDQNRMKEKTADATDIKRT
jgi:hypothetical protein